MQTRIQLLAILILAAFSLSAQDGLIGTGFANGWNYPADVVSMQASAGGSLIFTTNAAAVGDNFFRLTRSSDNNQLGPFGCADTDWSNSDGFSYDDMPVCNTFGAFFINAANVTDTYVFKTPGAGENDFIYFKFSGAIPEFEPLFTGRLPSDPVVNSTETVSFLVGLNTSLPAGGAIYMRYTLDGFANSTVVKMVESVGSNGQFFVADIPPPANNEGQTFTYYFFLSGDDNNAGPQADGSDADYRTISLENNGGANYSFLYSDPAPVTYRAFSGQRQESAVALRWSTATEVNARYFALECSEDNGRSWNERDQIVAANLVQGAEYSYLDQRAPAGKLQYRLRQVDFDGSFEYSSVITIAAINTGKGSNVFPNPFRQQFNLQLASTDEPTQYSITDLHGKIVQQGTVTGGSQAITTRTLPSGVYLLQLSQGNSKRESHRIVKF